ncbi:MAG: tetratricopeptide repeat protein [Fervidobacterium sp.]|uniref:tetratricopeptide repeat protein n=1 Tax=Fervidobacterium sp. TaxID=1871331 RepID=UPI00404B9557
MKVEKFSLILLTIFAILFIISYSHSLKISNELEQTKKVVKAYELYVNNDQSFEKFVSENDLKDLVNLVSKQKITSIRTKIDNAKSAYRNGNYSEAADILRTIKDESNPWADEIYFYLGMSLYKIGEIESAKLFLSSFIDNFQYSIYRKEALMLLREISIGDMKKRVEEALNKLSTSY